MAEVRMVMPADRGVETGPGAAFLLVLALMFVALALYLPTAMSMASIWSRSATYTHGWLVLPASLWFIWERRSELAGTPLKPWWPGLLFVGGGGCVWLLGELSGAQAPSHFALVAMLIAATVTATGLAWSRVIAFPLMLLFFAVPFGEVLVPYLMDWTADFTVSALQLSGVPVFREGNDLTLPSGRWSVVEACSGVRYLLASLMAGTLYAWIMYRSPARRAAFVAASLLVPIVANWLRAYLIVMLGHLSNNELAAGVDHLVYGWLFFGIVIGALFLVGSRWREDGSEVCPATIGVARTANGRVVASAAVSVLTALAVWPLAASVLRAPADERPVELTVPAQTNGWEPASGSGAWKPELQAPRAFLSRSYAKADREVTLHLGVFRAQTQGSELVSSAHAIAAEGSGWREVSRAVVGTTVGGAPVHWRSFVVRAERGGYERLWIAFWIGDDWTSSEVRAKADLALDRLLRRSDTSAWVALSAPHHPEQPDASTQALRAFVADMGPALQRALEETAAR